MSLVQTFLMIRRVILRFQFGVDRRMGLLALWVWGGQGRSFVMEYVRYIRELRERVTGS